MIDRFRGDNFFLSNMYPLAQPITTEQGFRAVTAEHAYQAEKLTDPHHHELVAGAGADWDDIRPWASGLASKRRVEELIKQGAVLREDWDKVKVVTMLAVVRRKFIANPGIAEMLIATGEQPLVEGNNWGDTFWGVSPIVGGTGENQLGNILVQVREELRTQQIESAEQTRTNG